MRAMRPKEGKTALIIDHVGNVFEHGLPDDKREWTLETKKKKKKGEAPVKTCPICFNTYAINVKECECGYIFKVEEGKGKILIDAELQEITREDLLRKKKYDYYQRLKTFEELDEFRKAKNYKFSWTLHKCKELEIEIPSKYNYMRRYLKI
jgi:superfamily II DNA or RNA helicase